MNMEYDKQDEHFIKQVPVNIQQNDKFFEVWLYFKMPVGSYI